MSRIAGVVVTLCIAASPALAEQPLRTYVVPTNTIAPAPGQLVDSHVVFLNRCTGGCQVRAGQTDSRVDTSDIGQGTLSEYPYGDTKWQQVMTCVKGVMAPFNITVTDVDPGNTDHFEIMVAGNACQMLDASICSGVGGIADGAVGGTYIPDALVFDYTETWGGNVTDDCSTISQEIGHAWGLDHVLAHNDPMTYNSLTTPLAYHDGAQCGSDCTIQNGVCTSPGGEQCSGSCSGYLSNQTATHTCFGTGAATQDEIKIIKGLFGPAGAVAPTVTITSPANGAAVQAGFEIDATCTSSDGVQEVDFFVDGVQKATETAAPYRFPTSATLNNGSHKIAVLCATNLQATATAMASVIIGDKCMMDSDCTKAGYICYEGACIAGPGATGGLGSTCTKNSDCSSGSCANDGTTSACVVPCMVSASMCPGGFGCIATSGDNGVCFPGADNGGGGGGGCCQTGQSGAGGTMLLSATIAALWITRRKKRKS